MPPPVPAFSDIEILQMASKLIAAKCLLQIMMCLPDDTGALIWHGSEMRHFRRLLSPPLQQLLARPSVGTLGRGTASMAADLTGGVGVCQALMHLATDAVQAAMESPFLEEVASGATGALCCVSLPAGTTPFARCIQASAINS